MPGGLKIYFTDRNRLRFLVVLPWNKVDRVNDCTASKRYKKGLKDTPNLTASYVHGFFTIALIKQIFEKKYPKSSFRRSDSVLA